MKKTLAILVAAILSLVPMFALADAAAETTGPAVVAQTAGGIDVYDLTVAPEYITIVGDYIQYAEDNFQILIPETMIQTEVPADMAEIGYYDYFTTEDASMLLAIQYLPSDTILDADGMIAMVSAIENAVNVMPAMFNGAFFVTYEDQVNNTFACMTIDASQSGYLNFVFSPNTADMSAVALQIMSSLCPIEVVEEAA